MRLTKLNRLINTPILQGGMGVKVSGWELARASSLCGQLGIVSLTGIDLTFSRRVQDGDPDGAICRALEHFPIPEMGWRVWNEYFGKKPEVGYKLSPMIGHSPSKRAVELVIVSSFVEVWLAKEGHNGLIGVNVLEKLQTPHPASIFGATMAGANVVVVGAGLPTQFPEMLERIASFETAYYDLDASGDNFTMKFDPSSVMSRDDFLNLKVEKPLCLGIVSTYLAAKILHTRSSGPFDGYVVERPIAGGHNAPPRNKVTRIYDMDGKDNPGIEDILKLGLPIWLAGGYCSPEALQEALGLGANGIQIGTAFSLCRESGLPLKWKQQRIKKILAGRDVVVTNHDASPTGYPFKEVEWKGSVSEKVVYEARTRICDIGRLRTLHRINNKWVWRCPSEPVKDYVRKGGKIEDTVGRKCICNGLMAALDLGQTQVSGPEKPIYTSGDDVLAVKHFELDEHGLFSAKQVIDLVLGARS